VGAPYAVARACAWVPAPACRLPCSVVVFLHQTCVKALPAPAPRTLTCVLLQNERQLLERKLGAKRHRNILQLHGWLTSRPYAALQKAAVDVMHDLSRMNWDTRAAFLVTDFVPWTLRDALLVRVAAREREKAARRRTGVYVQYEEYKWTIAVVSDVAEALLHLWQLDILHLDISTKNITIAPYDQWESGVTGSKSLPHAVLIDFGSAIDVSNPTLLGNCSGNRQHLAPEVLEGAKSSKSALKSDLRGQPAFELGVLAYEVALGGAHPLPDYPSTVSSWKETDLPTLPDEFPPELSSLMASCVRHSAADRPPLVDVVSTLRRLRADAGLKPAYMLPPRARLAPVSSPIVQDAIKRCEDRGLAASTPVAPARMAHAVGAGCSVALVPQHWCSLTPRASPNPLAPLPTDLCPTMLIMCCLLVLAADVASFMWQARLPPIWSLSLIRTQVLWGVRGLTLCGAPLI
jgi:hypothetical protein